MSENYKGLGMFEIPITNGEEFNALAVSKGNGRFVIQSSDFKIGDKGYESIMVYFRWEPQEVADSS